MLGGPSGVGKESDLGPRGTPAFEKLVAGARSHLYRTTLILFSRTRVAYSEGVKLLSTVDAGGAA